MKKFLLMMLGTLLTFPALARDFDYNGLTYTVLDEDSRTCQVKAGYCTSDSNLVPGNTVAGDLVVPSEAVDGEIIYTVIHISRYAFCNCSDLTSVTIPETVTSIGIGSFQGCSSLTSVMIPETVTSIGDGSFKDCTSLTSVTIPKGVTSIGDGTFEGCSSLTSLTIPEGVTSIGDWAFYDCI